MLGSLSLCGDGCSLNISFSLSKDFAVFNELVLVCVCVCVCVCVFGQRVVLTYLFG